MLNYGMLEEFITVITDTVPELLNHRQRAQLILGLQAKVRIPETRGLSSPSVIVAPFPGGYQNNDE